MQEKAGQSYLIADCSITKPYNGPKYRLM